MELQLINALANAGSGAIVAVVALFTVARINKSHEERIANMKKEYISLAKMVYDIAGRDIESRENYARIIQELVSTIQEVKESILERFKL